MARRAGLMAAMVVAATAFGAATSYAQTASVCDLPSYLTLATASLPRTTDQIKTRKKLSIVVMGTTSSTLVGTDGPASAYPAKLESTLRRRLEGVDVNVTTFVQSRTTSMDMFRQIGRILSDAHPALVIWQTGTVDAIRGVELEQVRIALSKGVDTIQSAGADVIFMNMQYSPRTENMIPLADYLDMMRIVAQEKDVPLFDRYSIMRYWFDSRQFDLYARARGMALARRVHECLARALSSLVIDSLPVSSLGLQVKP